VPGASLQVALKPGPVVRLACELVRVSTPHSAAPCQQTKSVAASIPRLHAAAQAGQKIGW